MRGVGVGVGVGAGRAGSGRRVPGRGRVGRARRGVGVRALAGCGVTARATVAVRAFAGCAVTSRATVAVRAFAGCGVAVRAAAGCVGGAVVVPGRLLGLRSGGPRRPGVFRRRAVGGLGGPRGFGGLRRCGGPRGFGGRCGRFGVAAARGAGVRCRGVRRGLRRLVVAGPRLPASAAHVHGVPSFEARFPCLPDGRSRVDGMRRRRAVQSGTPDICPAVGLVSRDEWVTVGGWP
ncbi:hypothetical protein GCM10023336_27630 [Streptomyces similanensis]|uniref:Uncharacterized protein n=1 Tax=Streptomyces similanensis TaxID=1274988 RepID=A0ABP9KG26_9ACTN